MPHARVPAIQKPRIQQNDEELFSNPLLDVAVWNSARTWSRMCFSCVFACDAHVTLGPLQVLSERSAVDRQSGGQFLALSPCFVCWSAGMFRNVGLGQVERYVEETAIPDRSLHHTPPPSILLFPASFSCSHCVSGNFHLLLSPRWRRRRETNRRDGLI